MTDKQLSCHICHQPLDAHFLGEKNGFRLISCKSCGSVMADPWVKAEEVEKFFAEIVPEIVHIPDPQAEITRIKNHLQKIVPSPADKSFLDISCRQGYAVIAAKELGMRACGIDPHEFFIEFAKDKYDANLFEHISVQEYAARGEKADFVYSVESFCEQSDPEGYMTGLAKLIAPGGRAYLQEPDGNHFMLPRNFVRWGFVDPPLNFVYLSKKGMRALMRRHGLKVEKTYFTMKPFMYFAATRG